VFFLSFQRKTPKESDGEESSDEEKENPKKV
jgi:hypothetical protein